MFIYQDSQVLFIARTIKVAAILHKVYSLIKMEQNYKLTEKKEKDQHIPEN